MYDSSYRYMEDNIIHLNRIYYLFKCKCFPLENNRLLFRSSYELSYNNKNKEKDIEQFLDEVKQEIKAFE